MATNGLPADGQTSELSTTHSRSENCAGSATLDATNALVSNCDWAGGHHRWRSRQAVHCRGCDLLGRVQAAKRSSTWSGRIVFIGVGAGLILIGIVIALR